MKGFGEQHKSRKKSNNKTKLSKEQIIDQALKFHSQGKILEASKYYQYFVDQGFKDHRVFSNYGAILLSRRELRNAEFYTRKAIELKPDFKDAHLNLGSILREIGDLTKAELYTSKAIELNPNDADSYLNYGNILKIIGKLNEAEISYIKAIELKPDFADAQFHLGELFMDLGKIKDYIKLSKSKSYSKSVNEGNKLLTTLTISIAYLINGSFPELLISINRANEFINQGKVNTIKDIKNKKYFLSFFLFIKSLYPLLEKRSDIHDLEKIPHFGESHCLSFAHQTLSLSSKLNKIQPVLITGGKAWYFAKEEQNKWKDSLNQQIKNHNYSDKAFISFGEIDCKKDDNMLDYSIKKDKDIYSVCENIVEGYLNFMELTLSPYYSKRYYFGVPAPAIRSRIPDELDTKRNIMVKIFNSLLKKEVLSRGSYFLDVYELTSTIDGVNNKIHMCDQTHLSPKCLAILFQNHLYKPNSYFELTS